MTPRRLLGLGAKGSFYPYVLLLLVAGVWGVFAARIDFPVLLHQPVRDLDPDGVSDVLSQYRFLRAIEAGFGAFALRFRREIFTDPLFNRLFLAWMTFGVLARLVGIVLDGVPSAPMLFFLGFELVGVVLIFLDTRSIGPRRPP